MMQITGLLGKLYNWYAVMGIVAVESTTPTTAELLARKKLAQQAGMFLDGDWTGSDFFFRGETVAGGKMKEAGTTHWISPNNTNNSSGFTGLPGGYRNSMVHSTTLATTVTGGVLRSTIHQTPGTAT
jgi:hypothetical protein